MIPKRPVAVGVLGALVTGGCSGGGGGADIGDPVSGPQPFPPGLARAHGRFVGTVTVAGQLRLADALLTKDGEIRLYVGAADSASGAILATRSEGNMQFVGAFAAEGDGVAGAGSILGEGCVDPGNGRFCDGAASVEIRLQFDGAQPVAGFEGEMRVDAPGGIELWPVAIAPWYNYYELPARPGELAGSWTELLAEFTADGDTIVSTDNTGRLFFQSPASGCTGNGALSAHADGAFNVYDIELRVESCATAYAHLDGDYRGLATTSPTDYWNYDSALRAWLTREEGAVPVVAITTWAPYIY